MSSLVRIVVCLLALSATHGALAADAAPGALPATAGSQPAANSDAQRVPPLLQRPYAGKQKTLDRRDAVPIVAHRRADGSLEYRDDGPLPAAAAQSEVHNDR